MHVVHERVSATQETCASTSQKQTPKLPVPLRARSHVVVVRRAGHAGVPRRAAASEIRVGLGSGEAFVVLWE